MKTTNKKIVPPPRATGLKCPTCGKAAALPASVDCKSPRPFCSTRCAEVDLGRWFQEQYSIPVFEAADDTIVNALIAEVEVTAGYREE